MARKAGRFAAVEGSVKLGQITADDVRSALDYEITEQQAEDFILFHGDKIRDAVLEGWSETVVILWNTLPNDSFNEGE